MGKDDSVIEKEALLAQKRAAENKLEMVDNELEMVEAKKRAVDNELADINTKLVAINTIIARERKFDEQKETLRHGPARGMDLVKKVAELNLQAEN